MTVEEWYHSDNFIYKEERDSYKCSTMEEFINKLWQDIYS